MAKMTTHDQRCQMCLLRDQGRAQTRLLDFESGRRHCPGLSRSQQDLYRPQHSTSRRSMLSFREAVNLLDRKLDAFNGTTLKGRLPNFGDEVLLLLAYETSFRQPSWELRPKLTQLNSHGPTKNSPASEVVQNSMTRRKCFADKSDAVSRPSTHTGDRGELYSQDMHPQPPRQYSCHGEVQLGK
jgi:hypothetical protein